jgi:HPt (histidine-containing phosphotransfer) domain-containing protein
MSDPSDADAALQARLAGLRKAFIAKVPDQVAKIRAAVDGLLGADPGFTPAQLDTVQREAHRLAGTAGSYGFDDFAASLKRLERATNVGVDAVNLDEVRDATRAVEAAAADLEPST